MSMRAEPIIAVGGENLIDTVQTVSEDGSKSSKHNLGGSPFNVAIALARQGQSTHYLTPISTDAFGGDLAAHLTANGVLVTGPRNDAPTTQAIVSLENGIPTYQFHRENTAERQVTAQSVQQALSGPTTHFHVGSLAFVGGDDALAWEGGFIDAYQRGVSTSLDPNVRASLIDDPQAYRARIKRLLAATTILKLSDEDLHWIFPDIAQKQAIEHLLTLTSARIVALTKGPDGAEIWAGSLHCEVSNPPPFEVADSIGAGDTFMATLIALLLNTHLDTLSQKDLEAIAQRCIYAACLNCLKEGCDPPTSAAIDDALIQGLPLRTA